MRQVVGLSRAIKRAKQEQFYFDVLSYGIIHGAKLPSFEEFMSVSSEEENSGGSQFDEQTDAALEAAARARWEKSKRDRQ